MHNQDLQRQLRKLGARYPLVGSWIRRRALESILRQNSPDAATALAQAFVSTTDPEVRSFVGIGLKSISERPAIDAIIGFWAKHRDEQLAQLISERGWSAETPEALRALWLLKQGNVSAVRDMNRPGLLAAITALEDLDAQIANAARTCLSQLQDAQHVKLICERWLATREPQLASLILEGGYRPDEPLRLLVWTSLLHGSTHAFSDVGAGIVEPLLEAASDNDRAIAQLALKALNELKRPEARAQLAEVALGTPGSLAEQIALKNDFVPATPEKEALFYLLTDQWERYSGLDFNQQLLQEAYAKADKSLRQRIAEKIRHAGRGDWIRVILGGRRNLHLAEMSDAELGAAVALAEMHGQRAELWWLAQHAPAIWSRRILLSLRKADWQPESEADKRELLHLYDLASRCPDCPPELGWSTRCMNVLEGHRQTVTALDFLPHHNALVSFAGDSRGRFWPLDGLDARDLIGHTGWVTALAVRPDQQQFATASHDRTVRLWDSAGAKPIAELKGHAAPVTSLKFSLDGRHIVSGAADGTICIWRAGTGELQRQIEGHGDEITAIVISASGSLATASKDGTIHLWSFPGGRKIHVLAGHTPMVACLAVSNDGVWLASGGKDKCVKLWRLETGELAAIMKGHENDVSCLAFSPAQPVLASGSWDTTVRLWSVPDGQHVKTLGHVEVAAGHEGWITCMEFAANGTLLATGSLDHTLCLWRMPDGRQLARLQGHDQRVSSVRIHPGGTLLASGSWDRTVRLWMSETSRLTRVPIDRVTLDELEWIQNALLERGIPDEERVWLALVLRLARWRRRYDVQLEEQENVMEFGEFDIELA